MTKSNPDQVMKLKLKLVHRKTSALVSDLATTSFGLEKP